MHLYPIDGVAGRVPQGRHRLELPRRQVGRWSSSASAPTRPTTQRMIAWTRDYWAALHPYSAGGAYVNMMMDAADEGQDRVRASYGEHYDRLAQIKAQYDPDNLFRVNQNITPA